MILGREGLARAHAHDMQWADRQNQYLEKLHGVVDVLDGLQGDPLLQDGAARRHTRHLQHRLL